MQGVIIAVRLSVHLGPTDSKLKALSTRLEERRGERGREEKRRGPTHSRVKFCCYTVL